jgi:hypothetical protein
VPDPLTDEFDRLFARAGAVEPPSDLFARVIARTRTAPQLRNLPLYLAAYLLALGGLALLAYELGTAAVRSGATMLVATIGGDVTLLADAPAGYLGALLVSIPWMQIGGVIIDLAILAIVTRLLLRDAALAAGRRSSQGSPEA